MGHSNLTIRDILDAIRFDIRVQICIAFAVAVALTLMFVGRTPETVDPRLHGWDAEISASACKLDIKTENKINGCSRLDHH